VLLLDCISQSIWTWQSLFSEGKLSNKLYFGSLMYKILTTNCVLLACPMRRVTPLWLLQQTWGPKMWFPVAAVEFVWCMMHISYWYLDIYSACGGMRWRSWLRHFATSWKVAGSIPDGVIGFFHWQSFRPHYGPGVDSASNRSEYQKCFLRVKAAGT